VFVVMIQMNMADYPQFYFAKDGRLCSTGQHCQGFPKDAI
jgi:hypothetical protein